VLPSASKHGLAPIVFFQPATAWALTTHMRSAAMTSV
jgi:hypothetical protein